MKRPAANRPGAVQSLGFLTRKGRQCLLDRIDAHVDTFSREILREAITSAFASLADRQDQALPVRTRRIRKPYASASAAVRASRRDQAASVSAVQSAPMAPRTQSRIVVKKASNRLSGTP